MACTVAVASGGALGPADVQDDGGTGGRGRPGGLGSRQTPAIHAGALWVYICDRTCVTECVCITVGVGGLRGASSQADSDIAPMRNSL
jgi:hypothetical protein